MSSRLAIIATILLLLAGCAQQEIGATFGETIKINYIGKFENGTVFDTNVQEIGESQGLEKSSYEPLEVKIGATSLIPGFTAALIGMKTGDSKTVTLPPSEAYGNVNPTKKAILAVKQSVDRNIELGRIVNLTTESLAKLPGDNEIGDTVEVGEISYQVMNIEDGMASLKIYVDEGDHVVLPNTLWNSTVVEITETTYTVRQDPENGMEINTPFGPARINVFDDRLEREMMLVEGGYIVGESATGRVTHVNDTSAVIDYNHPMAGKTLVFEIERLE